MSTVAAAAQRLADAGVPSARHDAEALAAYLLGVQRHALPRGDLGADYDELVARRAAREPLQYIVGTAPFRQLELLVGPGVYVPRPETELVAGWIIDALVGVPAPLVVDLCTGPGTIALGVADEVAGARVHAVELDPNAIAWARKNVAHTGLDVMLHHADAAHALRELDGTVDAVVSNPPYVPVEDQHRLDPEVRDHEPSRALYADDDGLAIVSSVVMTAKRLLRPGGVIAIEHSADQGAAVPAIVQAAGFVDVLDHRDLAGRDRFTTARCP
ncbi:MAG: release factor glutamine methyltransferase [Frankiales bacterium]|nr:release factor glutamine methyltransferase [Frankiales bacterium]